MYQAYVRIYIPLPNSVEMLHFNVSSVILSNSAVKQHLLHIPEITKPNGKEVIILSNQSEAFKIPCLMLPGTTTDSS